MKQYLQQLLRREHGSAVAALVRFCGSIDLAEAAVQDAFAAALEHWPATGLPPSPTAWLITTARNRVIDHDQRPWAEAGDGILQHDTLVADRLRLLFICCHPALASESQAALTLRLLGGLSTTEIAAAYSQPEPTVAQRLVHAKTQIRDAGIPFRIPADAELPARTRAVLAVIYSIFNQDYAAQPGAPSSREDLCTEAIRLGHQLAEALPEEPEAKGLLALMLLMDSRRDARVDAAGELVSLTAQNRGRWNRPMIEEGVQLVTSCIRQNRPGPYQIQAAINAIHGTAASSASTDWRQIVALYDQLHSVAPTPAAALNRAVAVAEIEGAEVGLGLVDTLNLQRFYLFHAVRADLLRRLRRTTEAVSAYQAALARADNGVERRFLQRQLDGLLH
jgi:RNA polymerase sigma-70 factor (ECF subfamily)